MKRSSNNGRPSELPFVMSAPRMESQTNAMLVSRFTNGLSSNRYLQNDYQSFECMKQQIARRGNRQLEKLRHIERARKQNKDINSIKQHKLVWRKLHSKLSQAAARLEREILSEMQQAVEVFNRQASTEEEEEESVWKEALEYRDLLHQDFTHYKASLLATISDLRNEVDNLYYEKKGLADEVLELVEQRLQQLKSEVEQQQEHLSYQLHSLQLCLAAHPAPPHNAASPLLPLLAKAAGEQQDGGETTTDDELELKGSSSSQINSAGFDWEGIPVELLTADFDYDSPVWTSLMAELVLLDEHFKQRLRDLDAQYLHVVGDVCGGWSSDEHMEFELVREQYQLHDLQNAHSLLLDRLTRHFPHLSTHSLTAHDHWCSEWKAYQGLRQGVLKTWQSSKEQLCVKVTASLEEAALAHQEAQRNNLEREAQIAHCAQLLHKVTAWKEAKAEEQRLQEELRQLQAHRDRERLRLQLHSEHERRHAQKRELHLYRSEQRRLSEEAERAKTEQLRHVQQLLAQQAVVDRERVQFRRSEREKKLCEAEAERQRRCEERERQEHRLEQLRSQVRVLAPRDTERTAGPTVASDARCGNLPSVPPSAYEGPLHTELFSINTFKESWLKRDNRTKVETALRKAGLHATDYGRAILHSIEPPQQPRRDTASNIKFGNENH